MSDITPETESSVSPETSTEELAPESTEEEENAPEATPAKAPELPKSLKRKFNLVVDGKNEDMELDLDNDEEVKKYLQKAKAADKRFQEAAEVRKAALQFIDELKKNPRKVLSDPNIGIDVRKFAEEILNNEIAEMEKTPEQREREQLQRELEEIKKQREDEKKSFEQREYERLQKEHERNLETEISAALDVGGLPKTPRTVKAMAEMMMIALQEGIDLSPKDIAPMIKNQTLSEFKEVVNSLGDDQLEDFLGKEVIGRLRKRNVSKAKAIATANAVKPTGTAPKKIQEAAPVKKLSIRDFLKV